MMKRPFASIVVCLLFILSGSASASVRRSVSAPGTPVTDAADVLGIGSIAGASVRGAVSAVQGTLLTLNTGGATPIMIETSTAKIVSDKSRTASIADIKPGTRVTAFVNTAPTLQPSSVLRAQLITIESLPDLEVSGTIDSIDLARSRFVVLGIAISVDANTKFSTVFPLFAPVKSLADLAAGQIVSVTARFSSGAIVANDVRVISPTIQPSVILSGTVKSIAATAWVLASRDGKDTTLTVNSNTRIVGDPKVGDSVQVMANVDSAHNYVATAIVKLDVVDKLPSELHGTVKSIGTSEWIIGGPPGSLAPDFHVRVTPSTVIYADPKAGDQVVAAVTHEANGSLTATKISKER